MTDPDLCRDAFCAVKGPHLSHGRGPIRRPCLSWRYDTADPDKRVRVTCTLMAGHTGEPHRTGDGLWQWAAHDLIAIYTGPPVSIANAQEGANRNVGPGTVERPLTVLSAYPPITDESTAQTPDRDAIRWQVQEAYAVGYGNSTGASVRDHHLAGLYAVADLLIDRHRRP